MDRGNRRVGAVTFRLGRKPVDEYPRQEPAESDDDREDPRSCDRAGVDVGGTSVAGAVIPDHESEEEAGRDPQERREHDRAHAGHNADQRAEHEPAPQVAGRGDPALNVRAPTRAAEERVGDQTGHAAGHSWSGISRAAAANLRNAIVMSSRTSAGIASTRRPISADRRAVTRSTRSRPAWVSSISTRRRSNECSVRRRETSPLSISRSHSRVTVDGARSSAWARSPACCGPRDASTTRARYCGRVISVDISAKERAAIAISARLAVRIAAARSSTASSEAGGRTGTGSVEGGFRSKLQLYKYCSSTTGHGVGVADRLAIPKAIGSGCGDARRQLLALPGLVGVVVPVREANPWPSSPGEVRASPASTYAA